MPQEREVDLGSGRVSRLLLRLAAPAITAQLINVLYNIVDRMYIGHIPLHGADALTGLGVTMPVILCISAFAALVSMGGAPRASIMMGRGDLPAARRILANCATALLIVSLLLTVVLQLTGRKVLLLFGASEATIGYAWDYLRIYLLGTIFVQLSLGLNAFITTQGFARTSMYTVLIGAVCNIVLDPIFIFAFDLGVRGAALATILSQAISCIWVLRFLSSPRSRLQLHPRDLGIAPRVLLPCMALGLSPFIMQFTESVLFVCFNTSLQKYGGDMAVGAMTIFSSVMQFAMLPLSGLTQGAQPIISFNFGARRLDRVRDAFRCLIICSVSYASLLWLACMLAPQIFILLFTDQPELAAFSRNGLRIYMAASLLFGVQVACQNTFIALGNAKTSLFLALLRKVFLLIPLIYLLPMLLPDAVTAIFLAEPVADTCAVSVTATLFFRSFRRLLREAGTKEKNSAMPAPR